MLIRYHGIHDRQRIALHLVMVRGLSHVATIRDVAQLAQVNASTVSRVLNGDKSLTVRKETRDRILQAAADLNYVPNAMARGLKLGQSSTFGLLVPDIQNPFFADIIHGVVEEANRLGYYALFGHTEEQSEKEREYVEVMKSQRVSGLILATAMTSDQTVEHLSQGTLPFVLVNRVCDSTNNFVAVDDRGAAENVVTYLAQLGHERVAHIAGPLYTKTGLNRMHGYRTALRDHHIPYRSDYLVEGHFTPESGYEAAHVLLSRLDRAEYPTAIFASNDMAAMGVMRYLREIGLRVPNDVSLVGFNDIYLAEQIGLTTVHMPAVQMGEASVKMLLSLIRGENPDPVLMDVNLVVRDTTAPPQITH